MATIRIATVLLLWTFIAAGQEFSAPEVGRSNTPVPKLPVVDDKACPSKGQMIPHVEITQSYNVYSSWQDKRKQIDRLKPGQKVTALDGINIIRKPDKAIIRYVGPGEERLSLKVGDVAFGYGIESDANDIFWAKGNWFSGWDEAVAEKGHCGFTSGFVLDGCTVDIVEYGRRDWWVHIKTERGLTGWVLGASFDGDKHWFANFYPLCHYGED
jgi:hypothetical protein